MNQDTMLTEEALTQRFLFQPNHLNANAPFDYGQGGTMYETYGEELAYVRSQPCNRIWTLVDGDGGLSIVSGFWRINRIGYFISSVATNEGHSFCVDLEAEMIEEGGQS
jgi:hypothetical protein